MISFRLNKNHVYTDVFFENKYVGSIKQTKLGYQYFPKGKKEGGDPYPNLLDCKNSLIN